MEQKNKLLVFIIIFMFMFLCCVRYINNDMNKFNLHLGDTYNFHKKLDTRTYRLLSKYRPIKDSSTVFLKEKMQKNEMHEERDAFNDVEVTRRRNKHSSKHSLNNIEGYVPYRKCKSNVCTERDSYFEKRILDKIYYTNNIRYAVNSDINFLKRCKKNKIYFLYVLFILFVVRLILGVPSMFPKNVVGNKILSGTFGLSFEIICTIMTFIFILAAIYIWRKIKKYDKILHVKSKMNKSQYRHFPKIGF
ncbi:Plasmodium exported protein, unknown function [Plasmodium malariae]|uniref:Fam-m protein n=1 Tax=Plasmodium malariae TaxID=5858 RepID=A0A1D3SNA5_PLAMA|nr:Plasmodium exported protein, unknown function [Plasmodium malariae]SCO92895.1 Plasmodium exported protein, unknown function [Plasmodium malariae]